MTAEFTPNQLSKLENYSTTYIIMEVSMNSRNLPLDTTQGDIVKFIENGKVVRFESYPVGMSKLGIPMIEKLAKLGYLEVSEITSKKGTPITVYADTQKFTNLMVGFAQTTIDEINRKYEAGMEYNSTPNRVGDVRLTAPPKIRGF